MRLGDLQLNGPTLEDVSVVHEIYSDPRTWRHYPSGCFSSLSESETLVRNWIDGWEEDGLSSWLITDPNTNDLLGNCGVRMRRDAFWNLGYRLAPQAVGQGIVSRVAAYSVQRALAADPDRPIVASLLEHNIGSARVAERAGLAVRHRGPDVGNPNGEAVRLIYVDRELSPGQLGAVLG